MSPLAESGVKSVLRALYLIAQVSFLTCCSARAQCLEGWLPGQGVAGFNNGVKALAVLPDGNLIAGGNFDVAGSTGANRIARFNPATNLWTPLGAGVDGEVRVMAVLPNGDLIVGGSFNTAGPIATRGIARYNPALNAWSAVGGVVGSVNALVVLPNGDLLAGGSFSSAGGISANNIARLNTSTNAWSPLAQGVGGGQVNAILALPGGDFVVGGYFSSAGGVIASAIARFSPTNNTWSAMGSGVYGGVRALALLPNGDILTNGRIGGLDADIDYVARYNVSTNVWSALPGSLSRLNAYNHPPAVSSLIVLPNGDVIAGGDFDSAGKCLARFSATNGNWSPLAGGVGPADAATPSVDAILRLPSGDLVVGGTFTAAGGTPAYRVARLDPAADTWSPLGGGVGRLDMFPPSVNVITVLPSGSAVVGGSFDLTPSGLSTRNIALYEPNTNTWAALGLGLGRGTYGDVSVSAAVALPDGDLVVGGGFLSVPNTDAIAIARYRPSTATWTSLAGGISGGRWVFALQSMPNGDVVVGGGFSFAGGIPARNIARFNFATNTWTALGSGTDGWVNALALLPSGDLIAGGSFTQAGGTVVNGIARYNIASDSWSPLGTGIPGGVVNALAVLPGGDLVVGGSFTAAGGTPAGGIARYQFATNTWTVLGGGATGEVRSLLVLANGDVLAGGTFLNAGGVPANGIARYRATVGSWTPFGLGVSGEVDAMAILPNGDLLVGGQFNTAGGNVSVSFARYVTPRNKCSPADVTGLGGALDTCPDGRLTTDDIVFFLTAFFANRPAADIASVGGVSSPDGRYTADDVVAFLASFFAGCP
jgi:WD40 repeat protein